MNLKWWIMGGTVSAILVVAALRGRGTAQLNAWIPCDTVFNKHQTIGSKYRITARTSKAANTSIQVAGYVAKDRKVRAGLKLRNTDTDKKLEGPIMILASLTDEFHNKYKIASMVNVQHRHWDDLLPENESLYPDQSVEYYFEFEPLVETAHSHVVNFTLYFGSIMMDEVEEKSEMKHLESIEEKIELAVTENITDPESPPSHSGENQDLNTYSAPIAPTPSTIPVQSNAHDFSSPAPTDPPEIPPAPPPDLAIPETAKPAQQAQPQPGKKRRTPPPKP